LDERDDGRADGMKEVGDDDPGEKAEGAGGDADSAYCCCGPEEGAGCCGSFVLHPPAPCGTMAIVGSKPLFSFLSDGRLTGRGALTLVTTFPLPLPSTTTPVIGFATAGLKALPRLNEVTFLGAADADGEDREDEAATDAEDGEAAEGGEDAEAADEEARADAGCCSTEEEAVSAASELEAEGDCGSEGVGASVADADGAVSGSASCRSW
jgi:hypothetical protein